MDRFSLWQSGVLRGANAFPRHTVEDLSTLRSWHANLVSFGVQSALEFEPPFALRDDGFAAIDTALDRARQAGLFATINYRSAPGRENFNTSQELFSDWAYHDGFVRMWRETARHLKGNDIVVGYDLMCEPHPEDIFSGEDRRPGVYQTKVKGTPADWNLLARRTCEAIREEDTDTPIIINSTGWAYPHTFAYLEPTGDARAVYSVHYYSPRLYTHQKPDRPVVYPGVVAGHVEPEQRWDKEAIRQTLAPVRELQSKHRVPIFVGEFGCARYAPGVLDFFRDEMDLYREWGWSWAWWDLRGWEVMDIEMTGDPKDKQRYADTPLLRLFKSYLAANERWPGNHLE